jgi:5-methylthioadenosine/S-adenosylhomocysteine deaminase
MTRTVLRNGIVIGFQNGEHRVLDGGDVVYADDVIEYVGRRWKGDAGTVIDVSGKLVLPGLISVHAHVGCAVGDRLIVDGGRRDFLRSGFINYQPRRLGGGPGFNDPEDLEAALRFGFASLLRSGVTTVAEMGGATRDGGKSILSLAGECGIRLYYAPGYNGAEYFFDERGGLHRRWDEAAGLAGLERAAAFIERHHGAHQDRVRGLLIPDEAFNSTATLLRRTREAADRLGVGISIHTAEQVYEFHEALREHGRTPVQRLADSGLLGPDAILGHCRFVAGNSQTAYPWDDDLKLLAESRSTVAHAPVAGARRGGALESFQRYRDRGINLAIGTDTYPLDILAEMRAASLLCKVTERDHAAADARSVFTAATIGGAVALRRDDLGRLAPGAKADIVVIDLSRLRFGPYHDPLRALITCGNAEHVERVVIAGRAVVEGGRICAWDEAQILANARASSERVWSEFPRAHWSGRSVDEVFPPSLQEWRDPR